MKGYKAFYFDMTCRPTDDIVFQYEIGKTFSMDEPPILCERGFHFWGSLRDVYSLYLASFHVRVCEVEALGNTSVDTVKLVTDCIRIVREITPKELLAMLTGIIRSFKSDTDYCRSYRQRAEWDIWRIKESLRRYHDEGTTFSLLNDVHLPVFRVGDATPEQREWLIKRAREWEEAFKLAQEEEDMQ